MWHWLSPLDGPKTSLSVLLQHHPACSCSLIWSFMKSHVKDETHRRHFETKDRREFLNTDQQWQIQLDWTPRTFLFITPQGFFFSPLHVFNSVLVGGVTEVWDASLITFCLSAGSNWLWGLIYGIAEDKQQRQQLGVLQEKFLLQVISTRSDSGEQDRSCGCGKTVVAAQWWDH